MLYGGDRAPDGDAPDGIDTDSLPRPVAALLVAVFLAARLLNFFPAAPERPAGTADCNQALRCAP